MEKSNTFCINEFWFSPSLRRKQHWLWVQWDELLQANAILEKYFLGKWDKWVRSNMLNKNQNLPFQIESIGEKQMQNLWPWFKIKVTRPDHDHSLNILTSCRKSGAKLCQFQLWTFYLARTCQVESWIFSLMTEIEICISHYPSKISQNLRAPRKLLIKIQEFLMPI